MRHTIDGITNTINPDVFLAENADIFNLSAIIDFFNQMADELERVTPLTDFEAENGYTYMRESVFSSFLDIFKKPINMLENQSDRAIIAMREARETGNSLKASQTLDRYKVAQARLVRFEGVFEELVKHFQELIGEPYKSPAMRSKAYNMMADKKMALMAEIDELIK